MTYKQASRVTRKPPDPPAPASSGERPALQLGSLDSLIGFHVRLTSVAVYRDFLRATSGSGLSQTQFAILEIVHCNRGVSQVDIANALSMDKATMMSLVDRLQEAGLMLRRPSTSDRRRQELLLTKNGEATVATMRATIIDHERSLCANLSEAEVARLIAVLKRIYIRSKDLA